MTATTDRRAVAGAYDLAALAKLTKGQVVNLRPIGPRRATERVYERALRTMLREIATEIRETILPGYQARNTLTGDTRPTLTADGIAEWLSGLAARRTRATTLAERAAQGALEQEAKAHTDRWVGLIRAQLQVDLENVVRVEALQGFMEGVALRTAALITGLYDDAVKAVSRITQEHVMKSGSTNELRKALMKQLRISSRRAKLIAVDQTGTLVSQLNQIRQEQAGAQKYTWSSSRDERTRKLHFDLDGTEYRWGENTGAEGGLPPGGPIRCRCVARAVLEV